MVFFTGGKGIRSSGMIWFRFTGFPLQAEHLAYAPFKSRNGTISFTSPDETPRVVGQVFGRILYKVTRFKKLKYNINTKKVRKNTNSFWMWFYLGLGEDQIFSKRFVVIIDPSFWSNRIFSVLICSFLSFSFCAFFNLSVTWGWMMGEWKSITGPALWTYWKMRLIFNVQNYFIKKVQF